MQGQPRQTPEFACPAVEGVSSGTATSQKPRAPAHPPKPTQAKADRARSRGLTSAPPPYGVLGFSLGSFFRNGGGSVEPGGHGLRMPSLIAVWASH